MTRRHVALPSAPARRLSAALLGALAAIALAAPVTARAVTPSEQLATADQQLVQHYETGRTEAVKKLPLVLLVSTGQITTYRGGTSKTYAVPAQASIDLKAVSHTMLGFFGVFQPIAAGDRSDAAWARAQQYRRLLASMAGMVAADHELPPAQAQQSATLIATLLGATDRAIARRSETKAQLVADERSVRASVDQIVAWAGKAYAQSFIATLARVRTTVGDDAWKRAWAIVGASPAATRDNLETAILIKALGRSSLGQRLFVSQNQFDPESLLQSVSGMYYDQQLSEAVFASRFRMWRDLFAPISLSLAGFPYYPQPATSG